MIKNYYKLGMGCMLTIAALTSCSDDQQFVDYNQQAKEVEVQVLSPELAKVIQLLILLRHILLIIRLFA